MKNFCCIIAIALLTASVFGQIDGNPRNWCRAGFFTRESEDFRIARVAGARNSKSYFFVDDRDECPGGKNCQGKVYVVGGDQVVVSRGYGNYSCVWFVPKKGYETVGWIQTAKLSVSPLIKRPLLSSWLGEWKYAYNSINFTENKLPGYLNVTGDAIWKGVGDNVHVGQLDGRYEPKGNLIEYSDGNDQYDCKASMRMVGKYLIVSDNMNCGGANVTFSGVYVKTREY